MTTINRRQFLQHLAGGALLIAGTTVGTQPEQAIAASSKTTTAKVMATLSDGHQIQILLNINAMPSHIEEIMYAVHVPKGVRVTSVTYTGDPLKGKERGQLIADLAPGNYLTDTVVTGLNRVFAVRSTTIMKRRPIIATGLSGVHLIARFTLT